MISHQRGHRSLAAILDSLPNYTNLKEGIQLYNELMAEPFHTVSALRSFNAVPKFCIFLGIKLKVGIVASSKFADRLMNV